MKIAEILKHTQHRSKKVPDGKWAYYQEWNQALFLHWKVPADELSMFVPDEFELDFLEGETWVSIVLFRMERIRPRYLPAFKPVSDFEEINIRTYVRYRGKPGVYFLNIEAGNKQASWLAAFLSGLPYRYSKINRNKKEESVQACSLERNTVLEVDFCVGQPLKQKDATDYWLTERYALFQDQNKQINTFEIHHLEWPVNSVELKALKLNYPSFPTWFSSLPDRTHYSKGVQVIAWKKHIIKRG